MLVLGVVVYFIGKLVVRKEKSYADCWVTDCLEAMHRLSPVARNPAHHILFV
jgi:hypothetical protein